MAEPSRYVMYPVNFLHVSSSNPRFRAEINQALNWQDEFDTIWLSPTNNPQEQLMRLAKLKSLSDKFCSTSLDLTSQIVSEIRLPKEKRSFKPRSVNPERYVEQGILVEFCSDVERGIYGGDRGAYKAAKRHMVALQSLVDQKQPELCLPLTCVVTYNGFRTLCSAWIPDINARTLQYGLEGDKFVCRDQELNGKIERICRSVRVGPHNFKGRDNSSQTFYGPGEIEGHIVEKKGVKKFYLLNMGRMMPPISLPKSVQPRSCTAHVFETNGEVSEPSDCVVGQTAELFTSHGMREEGGVATKSGILFTNGGEHDIPNPRASAFTGREVRGKAIVLEGTGTIFFELHRPEVLQLGSRNPQNTCYFSSDALSGKFLTQSLFTPPRFW